MCGRYMATRSPQEIARWFGTTNPLPNAAPRYNAAPSQDVLAVRFNPQTRERSLDLLRWGLVPLWAKDLAVGYKMINAKAETVAEKPAFRDAFKSRRCLIAADGFYEWKPVGKAKQAYAVTLADRALFAFAGLWERWKDRASGEVVRSCTIITTDANARLQPIHERMPVILDRADYARWLGEEPADPAALQALLRPYPAERMVAYPVGPRVGNVKNDDPSLLEPMAEPLTAAPP